MADRLARLMRRIFRLDEADARDERSEMVGARMDAAVAEHQVQVQPKVDRMRRLYDERMAGRVQR